MERGAWGEAEKVNNKESWKLSAVSHWIQSWLKKGNNMISHLFTNPPENVTNAGQPPFMSVQGIQFRFFTVPALVCDRGLSVSKVGLFSLRGMLSPLCVPHHNPVLATFASQVMAASTCTPKAALQLLYGLDHSS